MTKSYIESYFNDFDFIAIHKALTLRFVGEVLEILLNKPYLMPDRMEFFENNIENLVSLALYEQSFRDAVRNHNNIEVTSLPMITSILFHGGDNAENAGSDVNHEEEKAIWYGAFSSDGDYCLTVSWDHSAKLWDAKTGKCIKTYYAPDKKSIMGEIKWNAPYCLIDNNGSCDLYRFDIFNPHGDSDPVYIDSFYNIDDIYLKNVVLVAFLLVKSLKR